MNLTYIGNVNERSSKAISERVWDVSLGIHLHHPIHQLQLSIHFKFFPLISYLKDSVPHRLTLR
ncbi:MAG: hypothetical protein RMY34_06775 [Aulosira sp. DedQUE10]|nr:hypothetical protein [Aulosira sp. DedQUE10]